MTSVAYLKAGKSGSIGERPSARALATREPPGALYFGLVALVFFKLPYWALRYSIASQRPIPSWSWKEALYVSFVRQLIPLVLSKAGLLSLDLSGDQEASFKPLPNGTPVWIPKLDKPLVGELGEMMAQTGDRSVRVSAWWIGRDHEKQHDDGKGKVILYAHGGAFCLGDARPDGQLVMNDLLAATAELGAKDESLPHRVLSVEYRLSNSVSLPGMVADLLAAWRYLIEDCGHSPSDIVIAGDSAGGNLVLALTRYLVKEKPFGKESVPKGLILYSPWIDLSLSHFYSCLDRFGQVDILTPKFLEFAAREVLRGMGPEAGLSSYASSLSLARASTGDEFTGFPPAIVSAGDKETLIDENRALAKAYVTAGSKIELFIEKNATHSINAMPLGFEREKQATAERHARWLQKLWA